MIRRARKAAAVLCLLAVPFIANAGGAAERTEKKNLPPAEERTEQTSVPPVDAKTVTEGQTVEIRGTIRVVGNEPFSEHALTDGDGQSWFIGRDSLEAVKPFEQRTITVRGTVHIEKQKLANGTELPDRLILTGLTILP